MHAALPGLASNKPWKNHDSWMPSIRTSVSKACSHWWDEPKRTLRTQLWFMAWCRLCAAKDPCDALPGRQCLAIIRRKTVRRRSTHACGHALHIIMLDFCIWHPLPPWLLHPSFRPWSGTSTILPAHLVYGRAGQPRSQVFDVSQQSVAYTPGLGTKP